MSSTTLAPGEQEELARILCEDITYVANPIFDDAEAFEDILAATPVARPPSTRLFDVLMSGERLDPDEIPLSSEPLALVDEHALFLKFNGTRRKVAGLRQQVGEGHISDDLARQMIRWHRLARETEDLITRHFLVLAYRAAMGYSQSKVWNSKLDHLNNALNCAIREFDIERKDHAGMPIRFSVFAPTIIKKKIAEDTRDEYDPIKPGRIVRDPADRPEEEEDSPATTDHARRELLRQVAIEAQRGIWDKKSLIPNEATGVDEKLGLAFGVHLIRLTCMEGRSPRGEHVEDTHEDPQVATISTMSCIPEEWRLCWATYQAAQASLGLSEEPGTSGDRP
jgi:hypothetical protein